MSDNPPPDRLTRLGAEIDRARQEQQQQAGGGRTAPPQGALAVGWRVATELVAALVVGLGLGWLAFRFLPTPWGTIGLIVLFFLGAAAGMLNVYRAAKGVMFGSGSPPPGDAGGSRRG
jgi:ATP synthase protein I